MRTFHAPHTLYPPADDFAIALACGLAARSSRVEHARETSVCGSEKMRDHPLFCCRFA